VDKLNCKNCEIKKVCKDSFSAWIFFIIGLIATLAIRMVTVLIHIDPLYGKISWYIGVAGFLIFFIYKYSLNRNLAKIIDKEKLIEKTIVQKPLSKAEYYLLASILCSAKSEKERINYFFIFAVSALALIFAVYFDFLR